ncbi:hypothetical protein FQN52_000407 [Onygenales sp. PD_12]|nr:hypothetical protein FQN52_000407 [Onygenales sp. PD_12]
MPPLPAFSNNPFRTRADLISATTALLAALTPYTSPAGARIRLPISTGAHFDETAAQLEGYARPLWAVAALFAAADAGSAPLSPELVELLRPWRDGIAAGTDPTSPEFWGEIGHTDQRMVEGEIVAFALLVAPGVFYRGQRDEVRGNIRRWLEGMNGKRMPETNWRWFRIMANLALVEVCGVDGGEVRGEMEGDLEMVDGFYVGGGWSGDGWWRGEREGGEEEKWRGRGERVEGWLEDAEVGRGQQMDYYSGSFAIQFSQLLYVKYAAHRDPERVERYKQQAREFVGDFWRYFDEEGAAIPFGRSLTYRFAFAGIFSTIVLAGLTSLPPPLSSMGTIKGLLLRHLRWWARHSADIFHADGTMNIGFLFPNMYMSEDYNSPQSVYWCMKTLIIAALPETHEFWTCEELPHPLALATDSEPEDNGVSLLPAPMQILCNHRHASHHFLLSSSQFCAWPLKASQAKYCKFAYSSAFGFSVPTGPLIPQMAPDNSLALSRDLGATWAVKWKPIGAGQCGVLDVSPGPSSSGEIQPQAQQIPTLTATWHPWPDGTVEVETTLIPPTNRWPDWHVRVHVVRDKSPTTSTTDITTVEGGFAIPGRRANGSALPQLHLNPTQEQKHEVPDEGTIESGNSTKASALILSPAGVSGVVDLSHKVVPAEMRPMFSAGRVLKPDSNTNLMRQWTLIPTVRHAWGGGEGDGSGVRVRVIVVGVFCRDMELGRKRGLKGVGEAWMDRPVVRVDGDGGVVGLG